jgi:riboflavin kinase/FMN adenylyltransferase
MRYGVYSTLVLALGEWHIGAANVGLNPTFEDVGGLRFEVNLLNFAGDLYGREIAVFLIGHVRDEERFNSPDSLKKQMRKDAANVREMGKRALDEYPELWDAFAKAIL